MIENDYWVNGHDIEKTINISNIDDIRFNKHLMKR